MGNRADAEAVAADVATVLADDLLIRSARNLSGHSEPGPVGTPECHPIIDGYAATVQQFACAHMASVQIGGDKRLNHDRRKSNNLSLFREPGAAPTRPGGQDTQIKSYFSDPVSL